MAEITLADLLAWEPRLRLATATATGTVVGIRSPAMRQTSNLERELTWAVTARASAPMLPPLRGGELVLLPRRVIVESGVALPVLLRELASHHVVGVVLESVPSGGAVLPALIADPIAAELEGELNRLLTERRGDLYRAGTELERLIADLTARGADLGLVLSETARLLRAPVAVTDAQGTVLAASEPGAAAPATISGSRGWRDDRLAIPLTADRSLWIGPVPADRRALARLVGERVALAVEAALQRAAQARPRGPARASALAALLTGSAAEAGTRAINLGLPADARYRIALASPALKAVKLQRVLASLGTVHEAGTIDDRLAAVIEVKSDAALASPMRERLVADDPRSGSPAVRHVTPVAGGSGATWLALSSPTRDPSGLPGAAREARFVAALLNNGSLPGPVARFDAMRDVGPYQLLYHLWGQPALDAFAADALGEITRRDRRGTLRRTLLAYLEAGGSHVEAAARLGIHRNTLSYRLKQIGALTEQDPTDPTLRLSLHLALLAASLPPPPE